MMARTRKRDDDSQYNNSINSDTTSLAALDASSMSATGSRSSLTFSSSKNNRKQRPRKRQRKSLTDALQSISLDKDKGVPEQILKMGEFPFSGTAFSNNKACVAFTIATGNSTAVLSGGINNINGVANYNNYSITALNSQQQLDRRVNRGIINSANGDVYYDDENSQLTSSTVEGEGGMEEEDDYEDEEEEEDEDEDSQRKRLAQMTGIEKTQRKYMLELVFGKDHRESRKTPSREASSRLSRTPPVRIDAKGRSSSPPFTTISTTIRKPTASILKKPSAAAAATTATAAATTTASASASTKGEADYEDPADRKIEELLRRSLENIQKGSHPLQLPKSHGDNDNENKLLSEWTPWKTQDDMMVDPQIYSSRVGKPAGLNPRQSKNSNNNSTKGTTPMAVEGPNNNNQTKTPPTAANGGWKAGLQTHSVHFGRRPRSNSLPGGLDMTVETNAMDMDG